MMTICAFENILCAEKQNGVKLNHGQRKNHKTTTLIRQHCSLPQDEWQPVTSLISPDQNKQREILCVVVAIKTIMQNNTENIRDNKE